LVRYLTVKPLVLDGLNGHLKGPSQRLQRGTHTFFFGAPSFSVEHSHEVGVAEAVPCPGQVVKWSDHRALGLIFPCADTYAGDFPCDFPWLVRRWRTPGNSPGQAV
jgi:hypothetical protein